MLLVCKLRSLKALAVLQNHITKQFKVTMSQIESVTFCNGNKVPALGLGTWKVRMYLIDDISLGTNFEAGFHRGIFLFC